MVYGQTEVTKDLYDALDEAGVTIVDEADDVTLHDVDQRPPVRHLPSTTARAIASTATTSPAATARTASAGPTIPSSLRKEYERIYPFGWLGILSETPPIDHELIYAHSERGFALCSMRHAMLSRYYVQCPLDDTVDDWSDDRFWNELAAGSPPRRRRPARHRTVDREVDHAAAQLRQRAAVATAGCSSPAMPPTSCRRRARRA